MILNTSWSTARRGSEHLSSHLLEDVGRSHKTEADGLHDGVRVPPAPPVMSQPGLDGFVQLDFREATQSIAIQVRLTRKTVVLNSNPGRREFSSLITRHLL